MNDYEKYLREESPTFMGEPSVKKQRNYPNAADYAEATQGVDMAEFQRKILAAATPMNANEWTTGHCARKKAPGGCQLHNLQCGYPDCDRKRAAAPTEGAPVPVDPAALETLRRDAARYRWLRDRMSLEDIPDEHPEWSTPSEHESAKVDAAIDAALAANGEKGT